MSAQRHPAAPSSRRGRRLAVLGAHLSRGADEPAQRVGRVAGAPLVEGTSITAAQVEAYVRDGFVLCSGLVPTPVVAACEDALWAQMAGPPKPQEGDPWAKDDRPRPRRDDRDSWGGWAGIVDGTAITDAFTPQLLAAAEFLANAYESASPFPSCDHAIVTPPQTLAINIFPNSDPEARWDWPGPHVDGAGNLPTEPRACRIQHMTYITAAGRPGEHAGGGTVAWPGSSRAAEALYMSDKKKCRPLLPRSRSCTA